MYKSPEKRIVVVLDNFRTHHAKKVKKEAEKLNISLVYLPPYSLDLNSPLNVEELKEAIVKLSKSWIEEFVGDKFRMLCSGS